MRRSPTPSKRATASPSANGPSAISRPQTSKTILTCGSSSSSAADDGMALPASRGNDELSPSCRQNAHRAARGEDGPHSARPLRECQRFLNGVSLYFRITTEALHEVIEHLTWPDPEIGFPTRSSAARALRPINVTRRSKGRSRQPSRFQRSASRRSGSKATTGACSAPPTARLGQARCQRPQGVYRRTVKVLANERAKVEATKHFGNASRRPRSLTCGRLPSPTADRTDRGGDGTAHRGCRER